MRALVIGMGVSGQSAYKFLIEKNIEATIIGEEIINNQSLTESEYDRLFDGLSFAVVSPGISMDNHIVQNLIKRKIKVIGELELGTENIESDIIAVTGTNGKTTTVSLINFLLEKSNRSVFVGGNIGTPVTSFSQKVSKNDTIVLECSSFQLETIEKFKPHIACILNITEDHLIRHKTMENYIKQKYKITQNQLKDDYLLLNADSEILLQNPPKTNAKIMYFSTKTKVFGCYIKNNCIYFNDNQKEKRLISLKNINLPGEHNLSNILCACLAVYLETGEKKLLSWISKFHGVAHRIEFVQKINGVSFYNDSKATNIDSTLVAVKSFKSNINLILGGSEKGYEFDVLFKNLPQNVTKIAVFGQTKQKILKSAEKFGYENIIKCNTLKECILSLYKFSKCDDIILLSPACASFDQFKNFEERGNIFKKIVKEISLNESSLFESKRNTKI